VSGGESVSQSEWTALMNSAFGGHVECVQLLINAGAEKEASDNVRFEMQLMWSDLVLVIFPVVLILFHIALLFICQSLSFEPTFVVARSGHFFIRMIFFVLCATRKSCFYAEWMSIAFCVRSYPFFAGWKHCADVGR
jgi:hypothetical protein